MQVRQPFIVKDVRRVKRTRMVKKTVPMRKPKPPPKSAAAELESVAQRKKNINDTYNEVVRLSKVCFFFLIFDYLIFLNINLIFFLIFDFELFKIL